MTEHSIEQLRKSLRVAEGTGPMRRGRHMPYTDTEGVLTIGYGIAIGVTGITPEEAEFLLNSRIQIALRDLDFVAPWWRRVEDVRQEVLGEMMYQLGAETFLEFVKFRSHAEAGRHDAAADEMLDSEWHRQTPGRVERLAQVYRTGERA